MCHSMILYMDPKSIEKVESGISSALTKYAIEQCGTASVDKDGEDFQSVPPPNKK